MQDQFRERQTLRNMLLQAAILDTRCLQAYAGAYQIVHWCIS